VINTAMPGPAGKVQRLEDTKRMQIEEITGLSAQVFGHGLTQEGCTHVVTAVTGLAALNLRAAVWLAASPVDRVHCTATGGVTDQPAGGGAGKGRGGRGAAGRG
jgi:hypothetical protein